MSSPEFIHVFEPATGPSPLVLVLLHGTGGDERDLLDLGRQLAPGAALLSPRGQVLENGMPRFFRRLAPGVFDLADLARRTADLTAFLAAARERYGLAGARLVAVGYSNGANIAASVLLTQAGVFDGAILLRATVPMEPATLPALAGTPVLLLHGLEDPYAPPAAQRRLAALLTAAGAAVTEETQPSGHSLSARDLAAARRWLAAAASSAG